MVSIDHPHCSCAYNKIDHYCNNVINFYCDQELYYYWIKTLYLKKFLQSYKQNT